MCQPSRPRIHRVPDSHPDSSPDSIENALRAGGRNVPSARASFAGAGDVALLDLPESAARIVPALDQDLWPTAIQRRSLLAQSGVVLFRVHPATPERLAPPRNAFAAAHTAGAGQISIVTVDGTQMVAALSRPVATGPAPDTAATAPPPNYQQNTAGSSPPRRRRSSGPETGSATRRR